MTPAKKSHSPISNTHTVRVRYAETDQAGMAHHSAYLPWFEEGRVELLRSVGKPYQALEAEGIHFPVREAYCRYWALALFDDLLRVTTTIEKVGEFASSVKVVAGARKQRESLILPVRL